MKMQITMNPHALYFGVRERLNAEGYEDAVVPNLYLGEVAKRDRAKVLVRDTQPTAYWSADFSLFTDPNHTVRSGHAPAHKGVIEDYGLDYARAATWNQWGLWLGAMFDVVSNEGHFVKVSGYDWSSKWAAKRFPHQLVSSVDLFDWQTMNQFREDRRISRSEVGTDWLACQHKWTRVLGARAAGGESISECVKCGTRHRFGW